MSFSTTLLTLGLPSICIPVLQQPFNPVLRGVSKFTDVTGLPLPFFKLHLKGISCHINILLIHYLKYIWVFCKWNTIQNSL